MSRVEESEDNEQLEMNEAYECDSIGWNRNIAIVSPKRELPDIIVQSENNQNNAEVNDTDDKSETPDLIDEDNTPIFLNAAAGLFFPICHTQAFARKVITEDEIYKFWWIRFFR